MMKSFLSLVGCAAIASFGMLASASPASAQSTAGCATIKDGLFDSQGNALVMGRDVWGYNYQASQFNGFYDNFSRPATPASSGDVFQMKLVFARRGKNRL